MRSHLFAIAVAVIALASAQAARADIYKYVDDSGVIHFSNIPEDHKAVPIVKESYRPRQEAKSVPSAKAPSFSSSPDSREGGGAGYSEEASASGPFADIINRKCEKYNVDPSLVKGIIKAESAFNPRAVSPKGAKGLMQLMPSTADDMGVSDMFDPEQNIEGGVRYLRYLLDNFNGDVELSVAAYNCGQGRVMRNGNCIPEITETKNYVKKVMRYSSDPVTGIKYSKAIYRIELNDGSVLFSDRPVPASLGLSIVE
ncbi:MAG: lytic transglycosylase domain-containing protein [Nitrospirae bacterium]|nr:lytic transglycosylase domain-containing protein [Nitrospirota bacterium]MBI5695212.1 lytic transglycosylase domain-containing protein [Nitrospirota bacterium]